MRMGGVANVQLCSNAIGDDGCAALATAFARSLTPPQLTELSYVLDGKVAVS